ncbi:MAG: superoxide dismutase family protein [Candidatus Hydrogenedentota bacterium]|nr:MAG: superoxide dismutase family protein [Candidatus Hydrogenedentota bacterium]
MQVAAAWTVSGFFDRGMARSLRRKMAVFRELFLTVAFCRGMNILKDEGLRKDESGMRYRVRWSGVAGTVLLFVGLTGCFAVQSDLDQTAMGSQYFVVGHGDYFAPAERETGGGVSRAVAVIHPVGGSAVEGTVSFERKVNGILVKGRIEGLEPGEHGFHIHEFGDCSGPSGKTAGGHFNPTAERHGAPEDVERHIGDLGNIVADEAGVAEFEIMDRRIRLNGPHSIVGRAVVIHRGRDDLTSQPSGAAGPRVGCGVVGIARSGE